MVGILIEPKINHRLYQYKRYLEYSKCDQQDVETPTIKLPMSHADLSLNCISGQPVLNVVVEIADLCSRILNLKQIPETLAHQLEKTIRILMIEDIVARVAEYFNHFRYFECSGRPNILPSKQADLASYMRNIGLVDGDWKFEVATQKATFNILNYFFEKCFELLDRLEGR